MRQERTFEESFLDIISTRRIYLMAGATSGRYGIHALSALAMMYSSDEVFSGSVFAFCPKSRKQVRFIFWDDGGYWMVTRSIDRGCFFWPESRDATLEAVEPCIEGIRAILRSRSERRKDTMKRLVTGI